MPHLRGLDPEALTSVVAVVILVGALCVYFGVKVVVCLLVAGVYKRIPPQHREMEPGLVWLLMVPCFPVVWNFFVYPGLSRSLKRHFDSVDDDAVGDCGAGLATAYCIVVICRFVPCVNYLALPAALVLLIIYLVTVIGLKDRIPERRRPLEE